MRLVVLAFALTGCAGNGLPLVTDHCDFDFDQNSAMKNGTAACALVRDDGQISVWLDTSEPLVFTVKTSDESGYARLERTETTARHLLGETYGMTTLNWDGLTDWGGHAAWNIENNDWQLTLVATNVERGVAIGGHTTNLNGTVRRIAQ